MNPAMASEAPRSVATTGMTGMIAPSPTENRKVGRYAGRIIERHENGDVASVIASTLHPRSSAPERHGAETTAPVAMFHETVAGASSEPSGR